MKIKLSDGDPAKGGADLFSGLVSLVTNIHSRQGCIPVQLLSPSHLPVEEENSNGPTNPSTVYFRDEVIAWSQWGVGGAVRQEEEV